MYCFTQAWPCQEPQCLSPIGTTKAFSSESERGDAKAFFSGLSAHVECVHKTSALALSLDVNGLKTLPLQRLLLPRSAKPAS